MSIPVPPPPAPQQPGTQLPPPPGPFPGQPGPQFGAPQFGTPQFGTPQFGAPQPGAFPPPGAVPPPGAFPQQAGMPFPPGAAHGPFCRFCGSMPAVEATVRGHQGILIVMRFLKLTGPFCRDCGLASVRRMTANSMWQGWWGFASSIINPVTMLMNLGPWSKFRKLAPPVPGAPGQPMNPGRPLWQRPAILGLLLPLVAIGLLVFSVQNDPDYASVGDCVRNNGTTLHPDVTVVDCDGSSGQFKVVGRFDSTAHDACDALSDWDVAYVVHKNSDSYTLCLRRVDGSVSGS